MKRIEIVWEDGRRFGPFSKLFMYCDLTSEETTMIEEYSESLVYPELDYSKKYEFWFTDEGFAEFEKVAGIILTLLPPEVIDIIILEDFPHQGEIVYQDPWQIAIAMD
jgi:hypothetical protein